MSGEGMLGAPAFPAAAGPASDPDRGAVAATAPISVVVATRDTRELTLSCLAHLAEARPAAAEAIVVDDGSGDGTAEAIGASYPGVKLLRHPSSRGFTAAVNAGAAVAAGELLLLLNSDTEIAADALGALADAFGRDSRLGVAAPLLFYGDGRPQWSGGALPGRLWLLALGSGLGHRLGSLRPWRAWRPVSGHRPGPVDWVPGAALAIRRGLWESLGGFDPRFALYAQDLDLCVRVRAAGWGIAVVSRSRVVHHHGATVAETSGVTSERHNAALLWSDLVLWTAKHRGPRAARTAARLLRLGGAVQRALLRLDGVRGTEARSRGRLERRALLGAAAAVRAAAGERPRA
jgi:GT2 family glycosyltransferase